MGQSHVGEYIFYVVANPKKNTRGIEQNILTSICSVAYATNNTPLLCPVYNSQSKNYQNLNIFDLNYLKYSYVEQRKN